MLRGEPAGVALGTRIRTIDVVVGQETMAKVVEEREPSPRRLVPLDLDQDGLVALGVPSRHVGLEGLRCSDVRREPLKERAMEERERLARCHMHHLLTDRLGARCRPAWNVPDKAIRTG